MLEGRVGALLGDVQAEERRSCKSRQRHTFYRYIDDAAGDVDAAAPTIGASARPEHPIGR